MKILVVCPAFPPIDAGESEHCVQICTRLASAGIEVQLITSRLDVSTEQYGFKIHSIMKTWGWAEAPSLLRKARQFRPDRVLIIYSGWLFHGRRMPTYLPTLIKRFGLPAKVLTVLEIYDRSIPWTTWTRITGRLLSFAVGGGADFFFGTLLRDSDRLLPLSEKMLDAFEAHHKGLTSKSTVMPPPPLLLPDGPPTRRRSSLLRIAYFGYVYRGKGVDTLLKAIALARAQGVQLSLTMVGGGVTSPTAAAANQQLMYSDEKQQYMKMLLALVVELGLEGAVTWAGGYESGSNAAAEKLMEADVCVLPFDDGIEMSRSSVAVAAAFGLPLISTQPAKVESPFRDGRHVLLVPPRDPAALAEAITSFASDDALCQRLADGSVALARDWYHWNRTIDSIAGKEII